MSSRYRLQEALDCPWKVQNELRCVLCRPWVRLLFACYGIGWGSGWRFYGVPIVQKHRHSRMAFGPHLQLRSSPRCNPLGANHPVILCTWQAGACLEIGSHFNMTGGSVCAARSVCIGDHVVVGANTTIVDTDFHPLDPQQRQRSQSGGAARDVTIEDDVFIGMNCLILRGVTIGCGSVIGAGSVVTQNVPPGLIAAGNPARILREVQP
jgi:acetyltransferase-like isoleucine patch superfamily enzyme